MKKFKPEDLPWTDADTMQADLSKYHQSMRPPTDTNYVNMDFAKLEDITKHFEPPQPILGAFERVAKQIAEKSAQAEAERFLRMLTQPWLPTYTRQVMVVMQDNQKAQDFFERYIQPEIKPAPMTEAIQNHLNKESNND